MEKLPECNGAVRRSAYSTDRRTARCGRVALSGRVSVGINGYCSGSYHVGIVLFASTSRRQASNNSADLDNPSDALSGKLEA